MLSKYGNNIEQSANCATSFCRAIALSIIEFVAKLRLKAVHAFTAKHKGHRRGEQTKTRIEDTSWE